MMRVLMVTRDYPPFSVGGMGRFVYEVSELLVKRGIHVIIIAPSIKGCPSYEKKRENFEIYRVAIDVVPVIGKNFVFRVPTLMFSSARLLGELKYDVLHLLTPVFLSRIRDGSKVIYHFQSSRYGEYSALRQSGMWLHALLNLLYVPIEARISRKVDRIIAVSENTRDEIEAFAPGSKKKTVVLPNGVDLSRFYPLKAANNDRPYLLYVGRIDARKGVEDLLKAYCLLRDDKVRGLPPLNIAGDGPLRRFLEERYAGKNIRFLGKKDHEKEVPELMAGAMVVVVPSTYEPCSLVIKEALGCGVVVLSSTCSPKVGMPQFETGNYLDLARHLRILIEDKKLFTKLKGQARKTAMRYSWSRIVEKLVGIYNLLMD